jgi:gas vesicle protein
VNGTWIPFGIICEKVREVFDTWTFFIMDTGKTLLTFLAGAAVGAMTALLLAPDSGDKTRGRLRAKAAGVADMAKGKILEGLDAIEAALQEE